MSWLRRAVLSTSFGVLAALGFYVVLAGLSFIPGFKGWYEELALHLPFVPDAAKKLPWGPWMIFGVGVAVAIRISATARLKSIDFFLFSKLDDETLEPISPHTGMFVWHMPEGSEHHIAWDVLTTWLGVKGREARWPAWLLGGPKRGNALSWTILLGRNGTGKSQLARELGRHLARSGPHRWWRRVAWWRTADDVPWDAGLVARSLEHLARLKHWRPRAPTLLILDDPPVGRCEAVISTLARNQSKFWYPVRLLIVDQFIPPDLPILKNTDRDGWHHRDAVDTAFSPVVVSTVAFDAKRFRATLGGGFWVVRRDPDGTERLVVDPSVSIPSLVRDQDFERIVTALEGDPLLLGLATHWLLRSGASVQDLLAGNTRLLDEEAQLFTESSAMLREAVSHRIVSDRLEELYESLQRVESPGSSALRRAIACATLTGGIKFSAAARAFGIRLGQAELNRIFPRTSGAVDEIPPVSPWALGESFVYKVERDVLSAGEAEQGLGALIIEAWRLNPEGALRCLSRPGQLARRVSDELCAGSQLPESQLRSFLALARGALFFSSDTLDLASSIADQLDAAAAENALVAIERMLVTSRPNPEVACVLYCRLVARTLAGAPLTATALPGVLEELHVRLVRAGTPLRQSVLDSFRVLADSLIRAVSLWSEPDAVEGLLQMHATFEHREALSRLLASACREVAASQDRERLLGAFERLWTIASHTELSVEQDEAVAHELESMVLELEMPAESAALILATAWQSVAKAQLLARDAGVYLDAAVRRVDEIGSQHPDDARIQRQRLAAWRCQILARGGAEGSASAIAASIDEVTTRIEALAQRFPQIAPIQRERIQAWSSIAEIRSELTDLQPLVVGAAWHVEELAQPFPRERAIQLARAQTWLCLIRMQGPTDGAVEAIEQIASMFEDDPRMQLVRVNAWSRVAEELIEMPNGAPAALAVARRIDEMAAALGAGAELELARILVWNCVGTAYAYMPGQQRFSELAAQHVDQIAKSHAADVRFQSARASAWANVGLAYREDPERALKAEAAARRVDEIAASWGSDRKIQYWRADAWSHVAVARTHTDASAPRAADAACRVEDIARVWADAEDFSCLRASAWAAVAAASARIEDQRGTEVVAARVDAIGELFPGDRVIQSARARTWCDVAWTRSLNPASQARAEAAALCGAAIAERFPDQKSLQVVRARAWRIIAFARSTLSGEQARAQAAAETVDSCAARFPDDNLIKAERAHAWHSAARAWHDLGEGARAAAAVQRCLEILESIAAPRDDLVALRISLLSRQHPAPPAATQAPHRLPHAKPTSPSPR
jgi:hypothetical protein